MIILTKLFSKFQSWFGIALLFLVALSGFKRQAQEIQKQRDATAVAEAQRDSIVETIHEIQEVEQVRDDVGNLSSSAVDEQLLDNGWYRDDDNSRS